MKFCKTTMLSVLMLLVAMLPLKTLAQDEPENFLFPHLREDGKLFYYENQRGTLRATLEPVNETGQTIPLDQYEIIRSSFGTNIEEIKWSPLGRRALVFSLNFPPTAGENIFFVPNRGRGALNWWIYDFVTQQKILLNQNTVSAGWISENEIIYNFADQKISIAPIQDLNAFRDVVDTVQYSSLNQTAPVLVGDFSVVPTRRGMYIINLQTQAPEFRFLAADIKKILPDPFSRNNFVLVLKNGHLVHVNASSLSISNLYLDVRDAEFYDENHILIIGADNRLYLVNSQEKTAPELSKNNIPGFLKNLHHLKEKRFLISTEDSVYIYAIDTQNINDIMEERGSTNFLWITLLIVMFLLAPSGFLYFYARKSGAI